MTTNHTSYSGDTEVCGNRKAGRQVRVSSYLCWHWSSGAPSPQRLGRGGGLAGKASFASPFPFPVRNDDTVSTTLEYSLYSIIFRRSQQHLKCFLFSFLLFFFFTFITTLKEKAECQICGTTTAAIFLVKAIFKISTFAIISAYAIYNGSSSKELKEEETKSDNNNNNKQESAVIFLIFMPSSNATEEYWNTAHAYVWVKNTWQWFSLMKLGISSNVGQRYYEAQMEQSALVPVGQVCDSECVVTCTQSERCGWNARWAGEEGLAAFWPPPLPPPPVLAAFSGQTHAGKYWSSGTWP